MTDNVRRLPGDISLDLDSLERDDARPIFKAVVGGKEISLADPEEFNWEDLMDVETPVDFLRYAASVEDRNHIYAQKLTAWKLDKLMEAYQRHYGIDEKLVQARRRERQGR